MANSMFSTTNGLSSSKANHICNTIKERQKELIRKLNRMSVLQAEVILPNQQGRQEIQTINFNAESFSSYTSKIASYMQLNAYLREAIKKKNEKIENCKRYPDAMILNPIGGYELQYLEMKVVTEEELESVRSLAPARAKTLPQPSEQNWLDTLSIKELSENLSVVARASVIGQMIHKPKNNGDGSGKLWRLRENLSAEKVAQSNLGLRVITGVADEEQVDSLFADLQKEHEIVNSRANYYKSRMENWLSEEKLKVDTQNAETTSEYNRGLKESDRAASELFKQIKIRMDAKRKDVSQLKIVVPHELEPVLKEVLGESVEEA